MGCASCSCHRSRHCELTLLRFLLAQLHLDSLSDKTTPKMIRYALHKLPKGSEALDHAYDQAVERINSQKPGFTKLAQRVLLWIACAERPLTTLELHKFTPVDVSMAQYLNPLTDLLPL